MLITSQRNLSLDVLRGMTIALMVLVNNPGSWATIYAPFKHAFWHGFTPTDLVFPTFLFVIGNAMSFSLKKYEEKSESIFLKKIIIRSLLIFAIGLFLSAFPFVYINDDGGFIFKDRTNMHIMDVLQPIAICYLFAGLMLHYLKITVSIIISVIILLGYWWIMFAFGTMSDPYSLMGNAALKFDLLIFPPENLWKGFRIRFDSEGLLSTMPAVTNVVVGYVAGVFIQRSGIKLSSVWKLALSGVIILMIALFWDIYFPINKGIWTSSFVLYSVGWDFLLIAALILIIKVRKFKNWTYFLVVFGRNPLFIFVLSGLIAMLMGIIWIDGTFIKPWLYKNAFLSWLTSYNASLMFAMCFILVMWGIGYVLDKKKIYMKV